jgi:hypothetical protein
MRNIGTMIFIAIAPMCVCGVAQEVGHHFNPPFSAAHTAKAVEQLQDCRPHDRSMAVCKLGCCLYTNPACHPEVVPALITSLQCDGAYQVRVKAAWAIAFQNIANQCGWTALYVSSQLDPHWLVRDTASNALKVIETQLDPSIIAAWKTRGNALAKQWKGKYKPGKPDCMLIY